jgi:NADPH:quinone reductase-like Zn-dependent oxidoreductase
MQIGADVPEGSFKKGERVMALLSGGGYAEEVRVRWRA